MATVGERTLIVGSSGFLGSNIALAASDCTELVLHSSTSPVVLEGSTPLVVDLRRRYSGQELVRVADPGLVVNCAALADVDGCEADTSLATRLNAELPMELAAACAESGARFVHISSDAVFGDGTGPWDENSRPCPVNAYGRSKAEGERLVAGVTPDALVVRTNVVGWSPTGRRSLLEFFIRYLGAGTAVDGFTDVAFRPVSAADLWPLLCAWLDAGATGIVHATASRLISKHEFGVLVARRFGFDPDLVRPTSVRDAGLAAHRAPVLDVLPTPPAQGLADLLDPDLAVERLHDLAEAGYRKLLAGLISGPTAAVLP